MLDSHSDAAAAAAAVENVAGRQFGPDFEDIHSTFYCRCGSSGSVAFSCLLHYFVVVSVGFATALSRYPPHARTFVFFPYAVLSNAQVAVILQMSKGNAVNRDEELNELYRKTLKYVMRFNTMFCFSHPRYLYDLSSLSVLQTFRKETDDGEELALHGSEVASLMNLVATDTLVEEAEALIPSLARFPEAAMDENLDLIRSTMIRIVS
jgi:DNA-directed RNA polymerase II subunit RPB4